MASNYCIKYGINNNYKWILPFDSNAFFTQEQFFKIYKHINDKNCDVLYC